jgi:hypothetical protein
MRYQAGIVLPGYNALKVANAPTIGTASATSGTTVSVPFTAPACVGGGAISSYRAYACCGVLANTGASSPIVVSGLTSGSSYTFKVVATNAYGPSYPSASSNSVTTPVPGSQSYTTPGAYSWVAPSGVSSVSVVAIGSGSSGGGGGGLGYKNNYSVTPGNSYTVRVGGCSVFNSFFVSTCVVRGGGSSDYNGGTYTGDGGGNGGSTGGLGGGGAGGYAGKGGCGPQVNINYAGSYMGSAGAACSGAGGGGSVIRLTCCGPFRVSGGGGVGIFGKGTTGAATPNTGTGTANGGRGGSGGCNAPNVTTTCSNSIGGLYGGGATGNGPTRTGGAVRIVWPGSTRTFPSTCVGAP